MISNTPQLPVICLSDKTLIPGSSKWTKVCSDVRKALEDYGCFEASYDGVSEDLRKSFLEAMEELFKLPLEAKQRNAYPKPFVGYLTHNNLSESFGVGDATILEKVEEFTKQFDGVGNKSISETIQKFAEKLAEVDVMVRKMVLESFGLEEYIEDHLKSTNYRMRLMKYIAPPDADDDGANVADGVNTIANVDVDANAITKTNADVDAIANAIAKVGIDDVVNVDVHASPNGDSNVGAKGNGNVDVHDHANGDSNGDGNGIGDVDVHDHANDDSTGNGDVDNDEAKVGGGVDDVEKKLGLPCHTDKNLLTVLFQHEIEGLDVKTKDGKWIRVTPKPNCFVVIVGDSLCALMNGRIAPVFHRVRVTEKKRTRYSAAIFTSPNSMVDSPKELMDEKHPRVFKPFDYVDYMDFYHTEVGRKAPWTLPAYCAVPRA